MKAWLHKLTSYLDLASGRYQVELVSSETDRQACVAVLEEVRRTEMNRAPASSVLESHAFSGAQLPYRLMSCRDSKTGDIIGCLRITPARAAFAIQSSREEYQLERIPDIFIDKMSILTRLAVLKPYRKTPAALMLMAGGIIRILEEGGLGAIITCEPNLYNMYLRLGLRPLGRLYNVPSGGYRLPMLFFPDLVYLESIKSPVLRWKTGLDFERYEAIVDWYQEQVRRYGNQPPGLSDYSPALDPDGLHRLLTEGMSAKGVKAFLHNALVVHCQPNDIILAEEDGSVALGIVLEGVAHVQAQGVHLATLQSGQTFGEMAMVLNRRRTASITAGSKDTRVLLCSPSAYSRLEKDADRACYWQNLARVLAQRVLEGRK